MQYMYIIINMTGISIYFGVTVLSFTFEALGYVTGLMGGELE